MQIDTDPRMVFYGVRRWASLLGLARVPSDLWKGLGYTVHPVNSGESLSLSISGGIRFFPFNLRIAKTVFHMVFLPFTGLEPSKPCSRNVQTKFVGVFPDSTNTRSRWMKAASFGVSRLCSKTPDRPCSVGSWILGSASKASTSKSPLPKNTLQYLELHVGVAIAVFLFLISTGWVSKPPPNSMEILVGLFIWPLSTEEASRSIVDHWSNTQRTEKDSVSQLSWHYLSCTCLYENWETRLWLFLGFHPVVEDRPCLLATREVVLPAWRLVARQGSLEEDQIPRALNSKDLRTGLINLSGAADPADHILECYYIQEV